MAILSFYEGANGGSSESPIRVITCDARLNVIGTSSGYFGTLDAESALALYEEIFGRPFTGSTETYEDIVNLPAIPIFIKFTNIIIDSKIASSSLFFLYAYASPNDQDNFLNVRAVADDVSVEIVSL